MFFSKSLKSDHYYFSTGRKLRRIRERKGISLQEMANRCEMTKAAISNYENDNRQANDDRMKILADALEVPEKVLVDRKLESTLDVIYTLFEMESRGDIMPCKAENPDMLCLCSENAELNQALQAWLEQRLLLESGSIKKDQYDAWKDGYVPGNEADQVQSPQPTGTPESYNDYELRTAMKSLIQHFLWIYHDRMELIAACIEDGKKALALSHIETLSQTLDTVGKNELEKLK